MQQKQPKTETIIKHNPKNETEGGNSVNEACAGIWSHEI